MALALGTKPRVLLLDEPLAGLAAAERERVGRLIKDISTDLPVLLVEHDIDRVFALADAVTVMNEGEVLVDGTVEDARSSPRVQAVYIGSGATRPRREASAPSAARDATLLRLEDVNTFYGKSHILRDVYFDVRENEIVALLGRNGAGKSTCSRPSSASRRPTAARSRSPRRAAASSTSRSGRRPGSRAAASRTCRRDAACSPA